MSGGNAILWRRKIKVGCQGDCIISLRIKGQKIQGGGDRNGCNARARGFALPSAFTVSFI